ncbi:hypothetical protein NUU61_004752 [Penicillium alfredii]|uniref:Uncharacterized protein n=1 Tax=Penicillium alfredii TaxID=1506179 RepID=A0A9W9F8A8_9EURO|nr:uncharacterized protein NUU61_004752 [Penicillium alfredii]KAJ5095396.1 hypothetical protein NUU61_004752 [Penicillium alfredii]
MSADEVGDTASMSTTNGEPHPNSGAIATPGKRKRSGQDEKSGPDSSFSASQDKNYLHETLRSLVELLLKHDTELQLLSCPFPTSAAKPRTKRAKVSGDQETCNIQTRVDASHYSTLQEFLSDIEKASAAVIERNQNQANGTRADGAPLTEVVNRIAAFKKHMNSLVGQSFINQTDVKAESPDDDGEELSQSTAMHVDAREDKQALTLFGNPSNPQQLFSSLQKSVKVPLQSSDSEAQHFVEVQEELRETALPNGITTTKIVPYNLEAASKSLKRTFGEVFAPRPGLPQLEPPRRRSNRSTSAWIDPLETISDTTAFLGDRNNYCLAPLPSTEWLQYGGVTSSPSYWSRVEKHHAEGDVQPRHGDPALWTRPDHSLLQGVFSSFAPSFDSSGAVVQLDSKDLVWWGRRGAKRLRTLLSIPYEQDVEIETPTVQPGSIGELDESTLEEMVRSFNPDDFAENFHQSGTTATNDPESKDVEEMLSDISELLNTLSSFQRIRNLGQPAHNGQHSEPKETPAPDFGSPSSPSDAEVGIYDTLKSSLAALISNLPPYAVAKLDGDQLADLNISQKILVENPDYSGTMERDDYTLHQERAAAMVAAANVANRTSTPSAPRPGNYQGSQSAYNQRAYASNARIPQPQGAFQVPPQHGRQSSAGAYTQAYPGYRPPNTPVQRPGFPSQYSQVNPQYSQANNVPQYQRPTPNGYTPYSAQPSAQASPQPYTPRPGQLGSNNAATQGRTPYASTGSSQRYQFSNQTPSQGTLPNSAAAATYARSAAEQAALMDRNKAQLAAHQSRQSPSTPQPQGLEASASQEGSLTPGKQNGTPVPS